MKLNAKVKSKINLKNNAMIKQIAIQSLVETADAVKSDLQRSETMPFDTGELQNRSTFVDDSKKNSGKVYVVTDTPYARYQYFGISRFGNHAPLIYNKQKNKNAGCYWFEPYINGNKKKWVQKAFNKIMKGKLK